MEGRDGIELTFDAMLKGIPGEINLLFDADGKLLSDEVLRRPSPGRTIVLAIDYHMQKYAENALQENARNGGAMVIMDVRNGDILFMDVHQPHSNLPIVKKEKDTIRLSIVCYLRKKVWLNTKNRTRKFYEKHTKTMKNMRKVPKE
jgi:cell division protein FtsI/penicillin-binding protein 2